MRNSAIRPLSGMALAVCIATTCGSCTGPAPAEVREIADISLSQNCVLTDQTSATIKIDGEDAVFMIHNRSESEEISIYDWPMQSASFEATDPIYIKVRQRDEIVSRTQLASDGWWTWGYLWSSEYVPGSPIDIAPGVKARKAFAWPELLQGLEDDVSRFKQDRLSEFEYKIRMVVRESDNRQHICETEWF